MLIKAKSPRWEDDCVENVLFERSLIRSTCSRHCWLSKLAICMTRLKPVPSFNFRYVPRPPYLRGLGAEGKRGGTTLMKGTTNHHRPLCQDTSEEKD